MLDAVFEAIFEFILEKVLVGIFYWPGWLVLRIVTWGRYPPPSPEPHNETFVAVVGLATPLALLTFALSA